MNVTDQHRPFLADEADRTGDVNGLKIL